MKELTTRKIVLGLLMVLVLAFSVQGTAEAITKFTKTSSTDNQIVSIQQPFTIRFSVGLQQSQRIPDSAGTGYVDQDGSAVDSNGYRLHTNGHFRNAAGLPIDTQGYIRDGTDGAHRDPKEKAADTVRVKTTPLKQFHFNEESISITSDPASITFTKGSTGVSSLSEDAEDSDERLSSPISLSCRAGMAGVYTITIADTTTISTDTPSDYTAASSITFTITVLQAADTSRALTFTSDGGLLDAIVGEFGTKDLSVTVSGPTANARVEFEITKGGGSLSAEKTIGSKTSKRLSTLTGTDGTATVILDPKKGTNHVRAWIYGNAPGTSGKSTKGIYIYQWPVLKKVSGDSPDPQQNQKGPASSRLEEPFVVQLFDSTERTKIPGATITFTVLNSQGSLAKDPNFPSALYSADFGESGVVTTDSDGKANVFLLLGDTADTQQGATATLAIGTSTETVTFNASIGTVTSKATSIIKVAGTDGQSTNEYDQLEKPLTVVVRDQGGRRLINTVVRFIVLNAGTIDYDPSDPGRAQTDGTHTQDERIQEVPTDASGEASVRYTAPDTGGRQTVRASINNGLKSVVFTINGPRSPTVNPTPTQQTPRLTIATSGAGTTRSVTVNARGTTGQIVSVSIPVTLTGTALTAPRQVTTGTATEITLPTTPRTYTLVATDASGIYLQGTTSVTVDEETQTLPGSLSIDVTGTGATRSITVTATDGVRNIPGVTVRLRGSALTQGQRTVTVGTPITITLPTAPGDYNLEAAANGFTTSPVETFTVTDGSAPRTPAPTSGGRTLTVEKDGAQTGTQQPIRVRATPAPSRNLRFTVTRDDVRVGVGLILTTGTGTAIVTVPATGLYVLTVSAEGYTPKQVTFTAGTGTPTVSETPTSTSTAGDPSRIEIDGSSTRSGTEDTELEDPLRVRVLDDDDDPVRDARVIFRVRSGQGRLSQRGNGRATSANTNSRGYAAADYTPLSASSTVSASVNGVPVAVTFTISTGSAPPPTGPRDADAAPRPSRDIDPVVHVGAAHRAPMLWVDGGAIYALVGADAQRFAPSVDNALNLTVAGDKVYWTEKTGERGGTINSANLNGSDVTELASIFATPMGIAVDVTNSKLYWTNSAGRIQSANLDGSRITNVLQNLPSPMDIALAGVNAYWTQYDATAGTGKVGIVNPTATQRGELYISTGSDVPGSLVIAGGKVYWTETTGESGGTINSANLNGTGATQLASILAVPVGIAVDTARSKLYWTNSRGRVQSANLDGSGIKNVVSGLGSPGELVLSNSIAAPTTATTPTDTTSTTTASNKYDVNGDGSVDSKDVDVILLAVSAGVTTAKYDVNGDGKVDVSDVMAVNGNLDKGAAGAPTLLGTQFSALEISRLQEQIDLLIATGDRSPAAMRTLVYLQQLIVMARPEKTQLLANYPNPFNPETWIPYELATDTNVKITIYNTQGVVIRSLQLGHQSGGYYTGRDRAAYWDGRNALGEQVASGLYFYQLETDEMSSMRKMVILK